jgi:hypothetical protein
MLVHAHVDLLADSKTLRVPGLCAYVTNHWRYAWCMRHVLVATALPIHSYNTLISILTLQTDRQTGALHAHVLVDG